MNFGIIGTNKISDKFIEALSSLDITPYAVYSRARQRGEEFAARHGISHVYTSLEEMLRDESVDAVYVASPAMCHREHSIKSLLAGKDVLCEKPIATSASEFSEMKECAENVGRVLLEAMRPAFDPATQILAEAISDIGEIRAARLQFSKRSSRYPAYLNGKTENAFNPKMKNSALNDIGIYPLYLALRLFGVPDGVSEEHIALSNGFIAEGELNLSYGDKKILIVYSKIHTQDMPSVIQGTKGRIIIDGINQTEHIYKEDKSGITEINIPKVKNNMVYEIAEFIRLCNSPDTEGLSLHQKRTLEALKIIDTVK